MTTKTDLIYDSSALADIKKRITIISESDASDFVHEDRVSITFDEKDYDEYLKGAILDGYMDVSLDFQLKLRTEDGRKKLDEIINIIKKEKDASK